MKLSLQGPNPRQAVGIPILRATDRPPARIGGHRGNEGIHCAMKPVTVQPLKFPPVSLPGCPRRRIDLHDLKAVALPHKLEAVVVAERIRGPLDELVQLNLGSHQPVKRTQLAKGRIGAAMVVLKQDGAKVSCHRSADVIVGQLQVRRVGAFQLPSQQIVDRLPGDLRVSARCGRERTGLKVSRHQPLEGVEAGIDQEVEGRQVGQQRLLHVQCCQTVPIGQVEDREHPAQFEDHRLSASGLVQFRATWRVLVQDQPRVPDRTDQGSRRHLRDAREQTHCSDRLLPEVSRQRKHHHLGVPRLRRALDHGPAGRTACRVLSSSSLLSEHLWLAVEVSLGHQLDSQRTRRVHRQAVEQLVVVVPHQCPARPTRHVVGHPTAYAPQRGRLPDAREEAGSRQGRSRTQRHPGVHDPWLSRQSTALRRIAAFVHR